MQYDSIFFPIFIDLEQTSISIKYRNDIVISGDMNTAEFLDYFPVSTALWRGMMGNTFSGYFMVNADINNIGEHQWVFHIHGGKLRSIKLMSFQDSSCCYGVN
jgi:hypothetical protein